LLFLVAIVLILVYDWKQYTMFDKMFTVKKGRKTKEMTPVDALIEEPPHFRLKNDDEGEWVELQVKPKKAARKSAAKRSAKKAANKTPRTKATKKSSVTRKKTSLKTSKKK